MRKLVVGDLHFGIKSNSVTWLESQLEFFDKQIFDAIENKNIDKVVFLGDVHDIRYSINQQIGIEIRNLFRKMLDKFPDKEFIILAGNHDYYTPLEEYSYYAKALENSRPPSEKFSKVNYDNLTGKIGQEKMEEEFYMLRQINKKEKIQL